LELVFFATQIGSSYVVVDFFEPARFDVLKAALALDELLARHVNGTIVVSQNDAPSTTNDDGAY